MEEILVTVKLSQIDTCAKEDATCPEVACSFSTALFQNCARTETNTLKRLDKVMRVLKET